MLPQEMYAAEQDSLSVMRDTIAEAGIIESRVTRQADRNVYTILPSDRLKSYDINSLLDRLPGIKYDGISDRLTVNGYDAIVFVLDGVEISKEELKALSPEQIRSISIIHTPKIIFRIFFNVIPSIVVRTIKNSVLSNMYPQHIQYSRNPSHRPVPPSELFCANVSAFHDFSDKIIYSCFERRKNNG